MEGAVLVTGASRGIGRAVARDLAAAGATVIGMARRAPGDDFEGEDFVEADLTDARAAAAALEAVAKRWRITRLVANAGLARIAPVESASLEDYEATMALNVRAVLQSMQAVIPAMKAARFGRIVLLGSRAALGKEGRAVYSASKAALTGLMRTAALDLAPHRITINTVSPGPIDTELFAENAPPGSAARHAVESKVPLGRMGRPDEVAHAIRYFLEDKAGYTTGQTIYVCGGLSLGSVAL
ncbi:SDR family oxidoreductase [Futiania mangrovi]|uniref:SDR family oxidoreductase n=1 Tax=Futiania mangrovi TaxID=2959716 RepID=A0A9J6PCI7_9PROT|nr:SDR family oxidoreductase [Futiania mangrovii]MCP1335347.1 SDR family oxidoreductase [Futiania mangrovii]